MQAPPPQAARRLSTRCPLSVLLSGAGPGSRPAASAATRRPGAAEGRPRPVRLQSAACVYRDIFSMIRRRSGAQWQCKQGAMEVWAKPRATTSLQTLIFTFVLSLRYVAVVRQSCAIVDTRGFVELQTERALRVSPACSAACLGHCELLAGERMYKARSCATSLVCCSLAGAWADAPSPVPAQCSHSRRRQSPDLLDDTVTFLKKRDGVDKACLSSAGQIALDQQRFVHSAFPQLSPTHPFLCVCSPSR